MKTHLAQRTAHDQLDELVELETGLSHWEAEFVDSLAKQREPHGRKYQFSSAQIAKLGQIYEERITNV